MESKKIAIIFPYMCRNCRYNQDLKWTAKKKESQNYPYMCQNCRYNQYLKWTEKKKEKYIIINIYVEIVGTTKTSNGQEKSHNFTYMCRSCRYNQDLKWITKEKKAIIIHICVEIVHRLKLRAKKIKVTVILFIYVSKL